MNNIDNLKELIKNNNGWITTRIVDENNIHRQYLKQLENDNIIEKVSRGLYVFKGNGLSEFFILDQKYQKGIFSHNTALYFYNLTDRTPVQLDMTFPSNIAIHDNTIKIHYIKNELFKLGLTQFKLSDGTKIKLYDLERTVCDIIRDRNKIDPQIFNDTLKNYLKMKEKDLVKLYEYAEKFNIAKILQNYMEVL